MHHIQLFTSKTICRLCLQALDVNYREAIAEKINELARESQFIVTTFRPEMLEFADNIIKVSYNEASSVSSNNNSWVWMHFFRNCTYFRQATVGSSLKRWRKNSFLVAAPACQLKLVGEFRRLRETCFNPDSYKYFFKTISPLTTRSVLININNNLFFFFYSSV